MLELSIHILDIVQNSVAAGATLVKIVITESVEQDLITIEIMDNGDAMEEESLRKAVDPFWTTKPGKAVGLGLSLLAQAARDAGGDFSIQSAAGKGTCVVASFALSNVDRMPLGDIKSTLLSVVFGSGDVDFVYQHKRGERTFRFDTREVRRRTGGNLRSNPATIRLVREMLEEGESNVYSG